MELFAVSYLSKSNKVQHHMYGMTSTKKEWTVNAKDVEWLTVELADNLEM